MDSKDVMWFTKMFYPLECKVDYDIHNVDTIGGMQYQIAGSGSTVEIKFAQQAFESLVLHAKIGVEEIERARERVAHPNVQAAYDAYITLLALSKTYD
jgi:hypothetical protein